jgi:hypothetical protein
LLVSPDLASHSRHLAIDLKQFWFFRNLKAVAQLADGLELGNRAV